MRTIPHWINGQDVTPTSGNFGPVFNPALGELQAQVGLASVSEMNSAIAIAKAAFPCLARHIVVQEGRDHVQIPGIGGCPSQ